VPPDAAPPPPPPLPNNPPPLPPAPVFPVFNVNPPILPVPGNIPNPPQTMNFLGTKFPFTYKTTRYFLRYYPYSVTKKSSLPMLLAQHMLRKMNNLTSVNRLSWEDFINNDQHVRDYINYRLHIGKDYSSTINRLNNLWYAYRQPVLKNDLLVSMANSKYADKRRTVSKMLSNKHENHALKKLLLATAAFVLAAYLIWRRRPKPEYYYELFNFFGDWHMQRVWNKQQHTLITTFPRFSVYLEEWIKCIPIIGWRFIAVLERVKYGNWKTYEWHKKSMQWPRSTRVEEHFIINRTPSTHEQQYEQFTLTGKTPEYETGFQPCQRREFPSQKLPKVLNSNIVRGYATVDKPVGRKDFSDSAGTFVALWPVSTMVRPGNTYENQVACVRERLTSHVNSCVHFSAVDPLNEIAQQIVLSSTPIDDWYHELSARQKRNIDQAELDIQEGTNLTMIPMMIKGDEVINGHEKMVPRPLFNVSGVDFLAMGQKTSEIGLWLSTESWNSLGEGVLHHANVTTVPYFTCGASSSTLDQFVRLAVDGRDRIYQLLMGDDTLAIDKYKNRVIECDFSRYDRTQSRFLRDLVNQILERGGFSELLQQRLRMYAKTLFFKRNKTKCREPLPKMQDADGWPLDMRITGEPATCLDNSIINAITTAYAFSQGNATKSELEAAYLKCGLIAKIKIHSGLFGSTFLKGAFLDGSDGYPHWIRLPSFLLKLGKILTDPNNIYKKKSVVFQSCAILYSQWLGYGNMKVNWFYAEIDKQIRRICHQCTKTVEAEKLPDWKVIQSITWIDHTVWNKFMLERYNISVDEMFVLLDAFKEVQPDSLPGTVYAPMLLKLRDVDY